MSGERNLTAEAKAANISTSKVGMVSSVPPPVSLSDQLSAGLENTPVSLTIQDVGTMAGTASATIKGLMAFEPMVAGMVSMFFPPAAVAQPFIVMAMPFIIRALDDIQASNGGDMIAAFLELAQHLTKGGNNSPVLSKTTSTSKMPSMPTEEYKPDPSTLGSA